MIALVALLLAACGSDDGTDANGAQTVAVSERVWVDETRATPATAAFTGAPERTLRTRIWLPAAGRSLPLLVMAHGFGGLPQRFDAFATAVASSGIVVVAPAFPLTNAATPGGHQAGLPDYLNQPGDLSFVLTEALAAAAAAGDPLHGRIDPGAVAVLGQSLGGATVVGLTRKACCRDDRVGASVLAAAPWRLAAGYGQDPLALGGPPTLLLNGTADPTVPLASSRHLYAMLEPPRVLVGIDGAGHSESLESQLEPPIASRAAAQRAVIAFVRAVFRGADRGLDATLADLAAEGHVVEFEL